jgi:hypothetical protein
MARAGTLMVVNFGDEPADLTVDPDLAVLFATPTGAELLPGGALSLPPHVGVLLG